MTVPSIIARKAPRKIIEKMYGKEVFYEGAINDLIPSAYAKAADETDIEIVSQPKIDVTQFEEGKDFIFTAEVAVKPEVELGQYKGIEVTKVDVTVTEDEINAEIDKERAQNARTIDVTDRPVEMGDKTIIDFEGFIDGEPFEGGKGLDYPLEIGSHSFIDNFEDQLVGKNIGEEVEVNVTFPEEYHADNLAGKPAMFKVTVKKISTKELPELNDEFVDDVSEFDTVDKYKESIKEKLEEKKKQNADEVKEEEVIKKIIENSDKPGIIRDFTSTMSDVQFTLPASGFRATMTGINWFDALGLADVAGKTEQDKAIEQWSMFYKHMKNVSIGEFTDFEDFLKKTKYVDASVIMWALLTATTGDEEEFGYTCTNEKCEKTFAIKYNPHSVAHINESNITDEYFRASKASPGQEALDVFHEMGGHHLYYTLPDSGAILELSQPSAYDMIQKKLRTQDKLQKQLKAEYDEAEDKDSYQGAKLQFLMGINQFIDSIIIPGPTENDPKYKYTTWDDIVKILTNLSWKDTNMLSPLMTALAKRFASPIDMYVEDVTCPHCGKHLQRLYITNIQSQLLFNASRRYQNTEINLIETL